MEEVPGRRVTRSALQNGLLDSPPQKPVKSTTPSRRSKPKKKVKFVEPSLDDKVKNTSLVSDEGIDMSFTPHLSLPSNISRPVHKLKQVSNKIFLHFFQDQCLRPKPFAAMVFVVFVQEQEGFLEWEPAHDLHYGHRWRLLALLQSGKPLSEMSKTFLMQVCMLRLSSLASCLLVRPTPCSARELSLTGRTPPTRMGEGGCSTTRRGSGPPGSTRGGWRCCWWPLATTSTLLSQVGLHL